MPRDEETAILWKKQFNKINLDSEIIDDAEKNGMQRGRIFYYDEKKNHLG